MFHYDLAKRTPSIDSYCVKNGEYTACPEVWTIDPDRPAVLRGRSIDFCVKRKLNLEPVLELDEKNYIAGGQFFNDVKRNGERVTWKVDDPNEKGNKIELTQELMKQLYYSAYKIVIFDSVPQEEEEAVEEVKDKGVITQLEEESKTIFYISFGVGILLIIFLVIFIACYCCKVTDKFAPGQASTNK